MSDSACGLSFEVLLEGGLYLARLAIHCSYAIRSSFRLSVYCSFLGQPFLAPIRLFA